MLIESNKNTAYWARRQLNTNIYMFENRKLETRAKQNTRSNFEPYC